jgi:hypothetical protein
MSAYTVIASYAAGKKLEGNAWRELCLIAKNHPHVDDIADVLKNGEDEFKERTGEKKLPTSYRTAKSVILKARENGVAFMSENGEPLGKTAVEKMLREKADPAKPIDRAEAALTALEKALSMCSTGAERNAVAVRIRVAIDRILKV